MRAANEVWISLEVLEDMVAKEHRLETEVVDGVGADARLVGARVAWPIPAGGALVLSFDRPVPEVTLRDLRSHDQRLADAAAEEPAARGRG